MVRRALPDDRGNVIATVAAAFAADPGWAFILDGDYGRLATHFAGALFDLRLASQNVWVTDELTAVAMWDSPEKEHARSGHADSIWARYRSIAGEDAFKRLESYNDALAAVSPAEPHWYLGVLATHPLHQRQGHATAVLAPALHEADRLGIACYLETSTAGNRRFYERRGFTLMTEITTPGGPPTWWLRRAPQAMGR